MKKAVACISDDMQATAFRSTVPSQLHAVHFLDPLAAPQPNDRPYSLYDLVRMQTNVYPKRRNIQYDACNIPQGDRQTPHGGCIGQQQKTCVSAAAQNAFC